MFQMLPAAFSTFSPEVSESGYRGTNPGQANPQSVISTAVDLSKDLTL